MCVANLYFLFVFQYDLLLEKCIYLVIMLEPNKLLLLPNLDGKGIRYEASVVKSDHRDFWGARCGHYSYNWGTHYLPSLLQNLWDF